MVSFFNDLASEMVTPFIPILIATVLGAGPVILGRVEGVADAAASLLKLWAWLMVFTARWTMPVRDVILWSAVPGDLVLFIFARASETFILLRGNELGMRLIYVLLLWAVLNICKSAASLPGGRMADAFGKQRITIIS